LFSDYSELMNYIPNSIENVNLGKAITSMDTIAITFVDSTEDYFCFHYIDPNSIDLKLNTNKYSLDDMIMKFDNKNGKFSLHLLDEDNFLENTTYDFKYICDGYTIDQEVSYKDLNDVLYVKYFDYFQPISLTLNDYYDSHTFIKGETILL